ncbi:MAG: hypothetical protein Q4G43_01950 [Mobilicoccus sp.]|nr:hypothetical protein [Mobilicoccus sp.]
MSSSLRPRVLLGAPAPGGFALPDAHPHAHTMYGPRGVWLDDDLLVVADTGNHRVMIWHGVPTRDHAAADVVLGQPDATTEGPATGGPEVGMRMPTGVIVTGGALVVADAWHHRLLVWESVPTATATPPDRVLLQPDLVAVEPNQGRPNAAAETAYWPYGIAMIDGRFHVADTGNRRVLIWRGGLPEPGVPAEVVLGQPDAASREENRGEGVGPASYRWPHAFAATGGGLLVADAGNHRLLHYTTHPDVDGPADLVIGQQSDDVSDEFPYMPQRGRIRFPYGLTRFGDGLAVADTANNRVVLTDRLPGAGRLVADTVLGQSDPHSGAENRGAGVLPDSMCWPYAVHGHGDVLVVADTGNNRVVVWERE